MSTGTEGAAPRKGNTSKAPSELNSLARPHLRPLSSRNFLSRAAAPDFYVASFAQAVAEVGGAAEIHRPGV